MRWSYEKDLDWRGNRIFCELDIFKHDWMEIGIFELPVNKTARGRNTLMIGTTFSVDLYVTLIWSYL